MKKITDTQRLNFIDKLGLSATPGGWFVVLYDGAIVREVRGVNADNYDGEARHKIRQAIDAAILSEAKRKP